MSLYVYYSLPYLSNKHFLRPCHLPDSVLHSGNTVASKAKQGGIKGQDLSFSQDRVKRGPHLLRAVGKAAVAPFMESKHQLQK